PRAACPLVPDRTTPLQARPRAHHRRLRPWSRVRARDDPALRPTANRGGNDHVVPTPRGAHHAHPGLPGRRPARRVRPLDPPTGGALHRPPGTETCSIDPPP